MRPTRAVRIMRKELKELKGTEGYRVSDKTKDTGNSLLRVPVSDVLQKVSLESVGGEKGTGGVPTHSKAPRAPLTMARSEDASASRLRSRRRRPSASRT